MFKPQPMGPLSGTILTRRIY